MKNLLIIFIITLFITLPFSHKSFADCNEQGPNNMSMNPGVIIDCDAPVQTNKLNGSSMPASTTAQDDIVNVNVGGGINVSGGTSSPSLNTGAGDDIVNVNGDIIFDNGTALLTTTGADMVFVGDNANIMGNRGISTTSNPDLVEVSGGIIIGVTNTPLDTGTNGMDVDDDTVNILGGTITSQSVPEIIETGPGNDTLNISAGTFNGPGGFGTGQIITNQDNDNITLSGGTFNGIEIDSASDDDMINIASDIDDLGLLNCGTDNDTLIFSMDVQEGLIPQLVNELNAQGDDGMLEVNGITYMWQDCENRIARFNALITTISLAPFAATNDILDNHTVTATLLTNGLPAQGIEVRFDITSGPNQGLTGTDTTDSNGEATFIYSSNFEGLDTIVASFNEPGIGLVRSNTVTKTWVLIRNVPTLSEWGLIAMASLLGIVGFMVIRRRQLTA